MAPAAYVAENGLVGHKREEKPLVLSKLNPSPAIVGEYQGGEGEHPYRRNWRGMEYGAYGGEIRKGYNI